MAEHIRAFWIATPGRGEIRDEKLPSPSPTDVVVRAIYSGISRGTEALVFRGRVPVSEYGRMRAPFQAGDFPGPIKYGYASVGQVERGPKELQDRHVFVLVSTPDALRRAGGVSARASRRCPAGPRGAGRQSRDGHQRDLGCRAADRRSGDGHRRRHRRLSGRVAGRADRRLRRPARRHQSAPRRHRRGARRRGSRGRRPRRKEPTS